MRLKLVLRQYQCPRLEGGLTKDIFIRTAEKLMNTDYQKALMFVGKRKNMDRYRSMVDFLFCEIFPNPWRYRCFRFYEEEGPRLKDIPGFVEDHREHYDGLMCIVLDKVLELSKQEHPNWSILTKMVKHIK